MVTGGSSVGKTGIKQDTAKSFSTAPVFPAPTISYFEPGFSLFLLPVAIITAAS
jgi:hypothetical protein